nr:hypothetical protein [Tanacetum cinerariifolium]
MHLDIRADEVVHQEWGDSVERAITTDASLVATQDSDNIAKTQSTAMSINPIYHEIGSGDRPRHQETTLGGGGLQKKVKRLEKNQRARTPGMKLFKIGTSKKKTLDKENDVNDAKLVSIAGDAVNAASVIPYVSAASHSTSAAGPSTSTTEDFFKDEMTTMDDTLMAIKRTRPRTTSVVIHDVEEEPRRAIPPPTVQSQDKEIARRLFKEEQAQFEREQRIARGKATEQEAKDAALIEQMEDV